MPLAIGQVLNNRYRIVTLLGQGGMGAVYRGWDMRLNIAVAVKENLDTSPEAERQFSREAQILARLSHPNLPRVSDHFSIPGVGQYLVMDFVEGEDLESMLNRLGPLPEAHVVAWITQVCDALTYLHGQPSPIIHRDIKPANIRIRADGQAMLVDFGIAKIYDPHQATTMGAKAVTPGYSPPEQYSGHTDARSDIYSLGATLYTLLTGQALPESVLRAVNAASVPLPRQLNTHISPTTEQAIIKAIEVDTVRRFQRVNDFHSALKTNPSEIAPTHQGASHPLKTWALGLGAGLVILLVVVVAIITTPSPGSTMRITSPSTNVALPISVTASQPTVTYVPAAVQATATLKPALASLAFATVRLDSIANASLSVDYAAPLVGRHVLGGIPFSLSDKAFKSQAKPAPNNTYPTQALLDVGLSRVEQVYVVLAAGDAFTRWQGKTVGRITLVFDTAPSLDVDLILGTNLREWHAASNVVSFATGVIEVWQGAIAGYPDLTGTLDMLTIDVPADRRAATLSRIEVQDLSASAVGSQDPSLVIAGVTVAHR